jgi:hypothetical protein
VRIIAASYWTLLPSGHSFLRREAETICFQASKPMKMNRLMAGMLLGVVGVSFAGSTVSNRAPRDVKVSVAFARPETYADPSVRWSDGERDGILRELGAGMTRSAVGYLRDDVTLEVRVTNLDLAGQVEDWRGPLHQFRVIRSVYPPRMTFEYRLRDSRCRVLDQGLAKLTNPNFQFGPGSDTDRLFYDKALFRDWLWSELSGYRK